jgi:hypothetical protein
MCLRRAPEKYIAGAALDRAGLDSRLQKMWDSRRLRTPWVSTACYKDSFALSFI